nr:MAG TPA: hypothetical protein [Caudoviricetes sp.]
MIYISVPDMNDSISSISIDGAEYRLRFTYNETYNYWSFGLYNENDIPLVSMVKIVPNFPLLVPYSSEKFPDGDFGCISDLKNVGRNDFVKKLAEFVYIPRKDLL